MAAYYSPRQGRVQKVLGGWEDFTKEIYEEKRFGRFDKKNASIASMADKVLEGVDEPERKLRLLHEYVRDRMTWDETYRIFTDVSVEKAFENREGNSAEINLLLLCMLRKAGIPAHPVLVSTQSNGQAIKAYPLLNQFNSLIVWAKVGEKEYFLDATRPYLGMDMLPMTFLNMEGWILDPENPRWGKLQTQVSQNRKVYAKMDVTEEGEISGHVKDELTGYLALKLRGIYNAKGREAFISEHLPIRYEGLSLSNIKITTPEDGNAFFVIEADFVHSDHQLASPDLQYVLPFQGFGLSDNPLMAEQRIYPLDFLYPEQALITLVVNLPEGWEIEERPENVAFTIPDRTAIFRFSGSKLGGMLQIQSQYQRLSPYYEAAEYEALRQIFTKINNRHTSPIVLKKQATSSEASADE